MVWEGTQGQNMRPNRLYISLYTVLFVNANIGFSENLFLVYVFYSQYVLPISLILNISGKDARRYKSHGLQRMTCTYNIYKICINLYGPDARIKINIYLLQNL